LLSATLGVSNETLSGLLKNNLLCFAQPLAALLGLRPEQVRRLRRMQISFVPKGANGPRSFDTVFFELDDPVTWEGRG